MTNKSGARARLLIELLGDQIDEGDADLSDARIEQALTVGPDFNDRESRLLWRSPEARERLFAARDDLRETVMTGWQERGVEFEVAYKAAADGKAEPFMIQSKDFTLTLFPEDDPDMPWILSLRIKARVRESRPASLNFQLVDGGGMVWITGKPNSRGEINGGWRHPDVSPRERLQQYALRLTLV